MERDADPRERPASGPGELLTALLSLLSLDDLPRTGWILRGVESPESIAGHALGVAHVALALGPRVQPSLELGRVLAMAVVHDAPEAVSGDLPQPAAKHLPAGAKLTMDAALAAQVVAPLSDAARDAHREYEAQVTREARFVKACDRLHLGVRLLGYQRAGRRGLEEFRTGLAGERFAEFAPCAALAAELVTQLEETGR